MLDAVDEALAFCRGKKRSDLEKNKMLCLAVTKEIEIIGEAAQGVSEAYQAKHPAIPWSQVIGARNRLIHGYFDVDLDIVWATIQEDLPRLHKILKEALKTSAASSIRRYPKR